MHAKLFFTVATLLVTFSHQNPIKRHIVTENIHGKENDKFCAHGKEELAAEHLAEETTEDKPTNVEIVEGDIRMSHLLKKMRENKDESARDVLIDARYTWISSIIPYTFSPLLADFKKDVIRSAFEDFQKFTCIRFVERTNEEDYIEYTNDLGCWSFVGRAGGKQPVNLGPGCGYKGTAIHETMHALGFFHEHTRLDRDKYVKIHYANIEEDKDINFKKYAKGLADYYGQEYDFSSIMHYRTNAFSINGLPTIEALDKNIKDSDIGQRDGFSDVDLRQLNKAFNCSKDPVVITTTTKAPDTGGNAESTTTATTKVPDTDNSKTTTIKTLGTTQKPVTNVQTNPTAASGKPSGWLKIQVTNPPNIYPNPAYQNNLYNPAVVTCTRICFRNFKLINGHKKRCYRKC